MTFSRYNHAILFVSFLFLFPQETMANNESMELSIPSGVLKVDPSGAVSLTSTNPAGMKFETAPGELWAIALAPGGNAHKLGHHIGFSSSGMKPRLEKTNGGVRLVYDRLRHGKQEWNIRVEVDIAAVEDEFRFSAIITNNEKDWTVCWIRLPVLNRIRGDKDDSRRSVLWPSGLGQKFTSEQFGPSRSFGYPSGYSMQWIAISGQGMGLYVGCHDRQDSMKNFKLINRKKHFEFSLMHELYCLPGQTAKMPATVVMPFEGTWHKAARRYRRWVDTWMPIAKKPDWLRKSSGWMLCIMK
ncbi:MAG: hypothetical protein JXM70_02150, partial [Pirellulales bacterium]|nr:hypothetical protein [Pirellulales bacterium]